MILLTGASGLLGANILLTLQDHHMDVTAVSHRHPIVHPAFPSFQINMTDISPIDSVIQLLRPDWVIHCAAMTNVDWCEKKPDAAFQLHEATSMHIAQQCQRIGAGLVYISTDSVFDGETGNYLETDTPNPLNKYAASKLAGEFAVAECLESSLVVRTNIYGWNAQQKNSLAEWILQRLRSGLTVPGFYDVFFSPILVNDLAEIILQMMEKRLSGIYHVAASESCSKFEFARQVAGIFGFNMDLIQPVSVNDSMLHAPRPKNTTLNTSKISKVLNRPMPTPTDGILRMKSLFALKIVDRLRSIIGEETHG